MSDPSRSRTTGRPTSIADAGVQAAPTPCGLTGLEQRAFDASRRLSDAADAVERHVGPRAGESYDAKMGAWREAYAAWRSAMRVCARPGRSEGRAA